MASPNQLRAEFSHNTLQVPGSNVQVQYGNNYYGQDTLLGFEINQLTLIEPPPASGHWETVSKWIFGSEAVFSQRGFQRSRQIERTESRTGRWFLDGDKFIHWVSQSNSFLWLCGKTGCGKTMLCSSTISRLRSTQLDSSNKALVYHFFTVTDSRSQRCNTLLQSLVYQLANHSDSTRGQMERLYTNTLGRGLTADYDQLFSIFDTICRSLEDVYIIIDSLDECTEQDQTCRFLTELSSRQIPGIRIMASSNPTQTRATEASLMKLNTEKVYVTTKAVNNDIETYIRDIDLGRWDEEQKDQIISHITAGSDGSFRWAIGQLMGIQSCDDEEELEEALATLPSSLTATYERILSTIQGSSKIEKLRTILCWILYSARPLRIEELRETVAFDCQSEGYYNPKKRLNQRPTILEECKFLLTVDDDSDGADMFSLDTDGAAPDDSNAQSTWHQKSVLRLAHSSVVQFFQNPEHLSAHARRFTVTQEEAHGLLAQASLACILHQDSLRASPQITDKPLLLDYATLYWYHHIQEAKSNNSETLSNLIQEALKTDWETYRLFTYPNPTTMYDPWNDSKEPSTYDWNHPNEEDHLCGRCQDIRYQEITEPHGLDHGSYDDLVTSAQSCRLCKMMHHSLLQFGVARHCQLRRPSHLSSEEAEKLRLVIDANIHKIAGSKQVRLNAETNDPFLLVSCYCYFGRLHLFTTPESSLSESVPGRTLHSSFAAPDLLEMCSRWYLECEEHHPRCHEYSSSHVFPTRVIEIGETTQRLLPDFGTTCVGQYATLSQFWGENTPALMASDLINFTHEIPASVLTNAIRDAIDLSRRLRIRYLWVESLCVIHDDSDDPRAESSKVAGYFASAILNIVATVETTKLGLFGPRNPPSLRLINAIKDSDLSFGWLGTDLYCDPQGTDVERYPDAWKYRTKLQSRGWTMQEIRLARRNLVIQVDQKATEYSGSHSLLLSSQLYMQCQEQVRWENGRSRTVLPKNSVNWYQLVEDFSKRTLAFEMDRLSAFSDIAKHYAQNFRSSQPDAIYLAGMWAESLPRSLVWRVTGARTGDIIHYAPSWSWASSRGEVKHEWPIDANVCASVVEWDIGPTNRYRFEEQTGWMIIQSAVAQVEIPKEGLMAWTDDITILVRDPGQHPVAIRIRYFLDRFNGRIDDRAFCALKITRRIALLVEGDSGALGRMFRAGLIIIARQDTLKWERVGIQSDITLV